ncbi:MAG: DUF1302 family protein [Thermodesulfobacteriota bacterium]|nr:DUF1302 family protein [Thermodesulfobacteriota bacterium]
MKKSVSLFCVLMIFIMLIGVGIEQARADTEIWGDKLTMAGFLRYELAVHTGQKNPGNMFQNNNNSINLARVFFQTEWTYKPFDRFKDNFKLYSKIRLIQDHTEDIDSDLGRYDAFPRSAPSELKIGGNNEYQFEAWELYGDIKAGKLWLRLGRQQIAWGEMIAARIMDIINPLDQSWHFRFEPEEFENIRIPQWAIRGYYTIEQNVIPWLWNLSIEGFVNPGDISPDVNPEFGAPFNLKPPYPPFFDITERDRRGDVEYGLRFGGSIGQFYGTLNYLHLYTDSAYLDTRRLRLNIPPPPGLPPFIFVLDAKYPLAEIYGLTVNYAFGPPIDTVITFEGTYSPNQPYGDARSNFPGIRDRETYNYAILFTRKTFVFPRPTSAMMIQFQFGQTIVEGNQRDILSMNSKTDKTRETVALILSQPFCKADLFTPSFQFVYDCDDSYYIKPAVKIKYGDHWTANIWGVILGGTEDRPGRFGSMYWGDEIVFRVTYQF